MRILTVLVWVFALVCAKDYYKILDIDKSADERTIKLAYRRLSKMYHPDKNPSQEAHDKFIEVGEAYEVLSDPDKKKSYDTYGDPNAQNDNHIDLGDLFNQFFGGGPMGGGMGGMGGMGGQRRVRKGENKLAALNVALKDFYAGSDLRFSLDMTTICEECEGTGSHDKKRHKCQHCHGRGMVQMRRQLAPGMVQTFQTQCEHCGGKGTTVEHKCSRCSGSGVQQEKKGFSIYLTPGSPRDSQHVLSGQGDQHPEFAPGDIIVNVQEDAFNNWGYRRIGDNLYRTEVLSLKESLLGNWSRSFPFFDSIDTEITLSRKPGEQVVHHQVEVVSGKGMPIPGDDEKYGDLYIEYEVLIPEKLEFVQSQDQIHHSDIHDEL